MNDAQLLRDMGFSGQKWAEEFCKRFSIRTADDVFVDDPEGLMIGWFANALMRGYDERAQAVVRRDCALLPKKELYAFFRSLFQEHYHLRETIVDSCIMYVEENDLSTVSFT